MSHLFKQLNEQIDGEVMYDQASRLLYASDASPYQELPLAIARPKHQQDCAHLIRFAAAQQIPLIARGAGTSLAGQCVGRALIIDINRYMNRVISIDAEIYSATVEPGVVCDALNKQLHRYGQYFAPGPSTAKYCTLAGMAGNNAWGIHSLGYGDTRENMLAMEVLLSDGSFVHFGPLDAAALKLKQQLPTLEGTIYRKIVNSIEQHQQLIKHQFPAPNGIIRNSGYPLDYLLSGQPWTQSKQQFNLAPFLCGTEGTLALITSLTLKTIPLPQHRIMLCAHYHDIDTALNSLIEILKFEPAALEIIDAHIINSTAAQTQYQTHRFWLQGEPEAVLLIELHAHNSVQTLYEACKQLQQILPAYAYTIVESDRIDLVWAMRKAGLGLLMGDKSIDKAVTGMEDAAVNINDLADYVGKVKQLLAKQNIDCVIYGPAGRGVLHLRPKMNLASATEQQQYRNLLDAIAEITRGFHGSISAKHGDGRLRAHYLQQFLGSEIMSLLKEIKHSFDPQNLFNPQKIFDTPDLLSNLRVHNKSKKLAFKPVFNWDQEHGFRNALQKCNGAGVCLQRNAGNTMCPSYRATQEELYTTRGRANLLRQLIFARNTMTRSELQLVKKSLDLCLACKACKTECPANVDMSRLKSEFMQFYHDQQKIPCFTKMISVFIQSCHIAALFPRITNHLLSCGWTKRIIGTHSQRDLPQFAQQRFSHWWQQQTEFCDRHNRADVVLLLDIYSEYFEPDIAKSAVLLLHTLGLNVHVTPCLSLGRVEITQGLLRQAKLRLAEATKILQPYIAADIPIIGLEPSELLTLRDEASDLCADTIQRKTFEAIAGHAFLFEEFLLRHQTLLKKSLIATQETKHIWLHGHCHQKALTGMQASLQLLSILPNTHVHEIDSGCCGMAGAFGYQQAHYEISIQIAEMALFPALRNAGPDALIAASGTSCRQQIAASGIHKAQHPAQIIADYMKITKTEPIQ